MQLLLFRKNHARLACSVVNALTTAHCRYQLLRIADPHTLRTPHSATVLPPFHWAGLLFKRRTEFDIAAAFHTDARNQMLAGFANINA